MTHCIAVNCPYTRHSALICENLYCIKAHSVRNQPKIGPVAEITLYPSDTPVGETECSAYILAKAILLIFLCNSFTEKMSWECGYDGAFVTPEPDRSNCTEDWIYDVEENVSRILN